MMSSTLITVLLWTAALSSGLMAGVYLLFWIHHEGIRAGKQGVKIIQAEIDSRESSSVSFSEKEITYSNF